jgi:hypothetical protein
LSRTRLAERWLLSAALAIVCLQAPSTFAQKDHSRDETRMLTGKVFSSADEPVQKAIVYLKNTKSLAIRTYISDADGSYHFPALAPNVDYEVYAEFNGARSDTKTLSAFDDRKIFNVFLRLHSK